MMHTSNKQHLTLLLDRPDAWFLVLFLLFRHEYRFLNVSEHEIAMRIVGLKVTVSI
jgi:hypothetical protein